MASRFIKPLLRSIPKFSERTGRRVARWSSGKLIKELDGAATDKFLELLLGGMDVAFCLIKDYRENIENFNCCYQFETRDGSVKSGAIFKNGEMKIQGEGIPFPDAKVTFEDPESFWKYILSKDQDLFDLILKNKIEIDGNMNLIFKFCFMAKELKQRLGLET
jgi:hypothetical protein